MIKGQMTGWRFQTGKELECARNWLVERGLLAHIDYEKMEKHNELFGSLPSFNGYGSREEIEEEYELLVPQEKLQNYSDWNEIFDMVEAGSSCR